MYLYWDDSYLYYAVVTGFPIGSTEQGYRCGDLAFNFANQGFKYGIEIPGDDSFQKGAMYDVKEWGKGLNNWGGGAYYGGAYVGAPTNMIQVNSKITDSDMLTYKYTGLQDHYIVEGSIRHSYFGSDWGKPFVAHLTETCGNDVIEVNAHVPEPSTVAMIIMGLFGAGMIRRKFNS
jgi:hypothetical protein